MKTKRSIYLVAALSLVALASCKYDSEIFDGPDLNDLYGDFIIEQTFQANCDSVDFSILLQKVNFSAVFSKPVDWQITITGLSSGAIKTVSGKSKTIDVSNSTWNGSTTVFPMFNKENCAVMLSFPSEPDTLRDTVKIIETKIDAGFLIADFNTGAPTGTSQISTYGQYTSDPPTPLPPTPTAFIQSGASMDFKAKNTETVAEGAYYYNMAGTVNWDWAIGLIEFPASTYSLTYFPLGTNPDNVYFNLLVWGEPGISNALLQFSFREDDNGNGVFNSGSDDEAVYEIKNINWVGWKLVSIKYSGTTLSTNGNGLYNPEKIVSMRAFLLADPSSGFSKCKMDYMIFTANKPLEP